MSQFRVTYEAALPVGADVVIAPAGLTTPQGGCLGFDAEGAEVTKTTEAQTGQGAYRVTPAGDSIALTWTFEDATTGAYPEVMFEPRDTRFTRFADALAVEAREAARNLRGVDRATALACAAADRFTYGHPEDRFNDGMDAIPALGCGLTEGSCVDINTYFIASLRAAGIEAGYVTGFFFPAEKRNHCEDGHCWVVTRIGGEPQEWDIAHHLKLGTRDIKPGLNPKPGFRAACFHSMGLDFPTLGVKELKALIEPVALVDGSVQHFEAPQIRLRHPGLVATAAE
ncbi:MAG: transglutaminase domain-containing protein [Pseudomonadota bacterium]